MDIRDRINQIIWDWIGTDDIGVEVIADQILSLEIGGEVEESCTCKNGERYEPDLPYTIRCGLCNGTGKITRKRLIRDTMRKGE